MKARVKATGDIIDVEHIIHTLSGGRNVERYETEDAIYVVDELDFDVKEKSLPKDEPDYWEKLKHQYAGMAMRGLLSNSSYIENFVKYSVEGDSLAERVSINAIDYATTLINKLKEESQCKE